MLEYAGSQRAGLQRHRGEGVALVAVLRSLDWLLVAGVAGLVAVGLWAISGVTRFDIPGDPNYYLQRQIVYVAVGGVGARSSALLVDPDVYRRYWRPIFIGTVGADRDRARASAARRAARRAGSTSASSRSSRPSSGSSSSSSRSRASSPSARSARPTCARRCGRSGSARSRSCSSSPSPTSGRRSSTWRRSARCSSSAGRRGSSSTVLGSLGVLVVVVRALGRPGRRRELPQAYQKSRLTCFVHPQKCTVDARYNLEQSIAAVGSGQFHGRGPKNATQTRLNFLPEHGTDFVFASYSEQRGFVGASLLLALYLLVLWRGAAHRHGRARPLLGDRRRRHRRRAALPDLRERRHDDGDRADHRHPACRS